MDSLPPSSVRTAKKKNPGSPMDSMPQSCLPARASFRSPDVLQYFFFKWHAFITSFSDLSFGSRLLRSPEIVPH